MDINDISRVQQISLPNPSNIIGYLLDIRRYLDISGYSSHHIIGHMAPPLTMDDPWTAFQGGLGVTSEALRAGVPVITSGILCPGPRGSSGGRETEDTR